MQTGRGTTVDIAFGFGTLRQDSLDRALEVAHGVFIEPLELLDEVGLFDTCHIARLDHREMPSDGYVLIAPKAERGSWDKSGRLWRAMNYSRLVWPNVMSREFVAQADVAKDGALADIEAPEVPAFLARAYLAPRVRPAFPSQRDVELLRRVLRSPAAGARTSRIGTAMWRYAHASFMYAANFRLTAVMGAIETLVNTQHRHAREQFLTRVAGLSRLCLGHRRNGRTWARRVYKVRNTLAHGRRLIHHRRGRSPEAFERAYEVLIGEVEEFVRQVLLAAYTRRDVRTTLQSPKKVAARWPVKA